MDSAILDIIDCSRHVSNGYKKDATYVATLFKPHMERIDPMKKFWDLVIFDGATNVQQAGEILGEWFPLVDVIHGAEHVCALFFEDIFKLPHFELLAQVSERFRNLFGSSRHKSTAMFNKYSKAANGGKKVGFIKPAKTRMAGRMIAIMRMIRLQGILVATTISHEFRRYVKTRLVLCT